MGRLGELSNSLKEELFSTVDRDFDAATLPEWDVLNTGRFPFHAGGPAGLSPIAST
jgi:hypothetical protein